MTDDKRGLCSRFFFYKKQRAVRKGGPFPLPLFIRDLLEAEVDSCHAGSLDRFGRFRGRNGDN
jgi:hypothetical protein